MTQAELNNAVGEAISHYSGQLVAYQGGYKGECLSLVKQIWTNITGLTMPGAVNGYNWADGYWIYFDQSLPLPTLFTKTTYVPGAAYPTGSLVIYAATHHIALWLYDNGNGTHTVFEQNADPDGSAAHISSRANTRITGILVPKVTGAVAAGGKGGDVAIKQGDEMIQDTDNEFWRWQITAKYIRGRVMTRDEFRNAAVNRTWLEALQILDDDPEALAAQKAQEVGQTALQDNWEGQINTLNAQVKDLSARLNIDTTKLAPNEASLLVKIAAFFGIGK